MTFLNDIENLVNGLYATITELRRERSDLLKVIEGLRKELNKTNKKP